LRVVKELGETNDVLGHKCKGYLVETWVESAEGERFNERVEKVWMTTGLSIDWDAYEKISEYGMRLQNYDDALVDAFAAVAGYPMMIDADVFMKGFSVKETENVLEVIETKPDTDVYSLPAYFKKKEQLSMADLRG